MFADYYRDQRKKQLNLTLQYSSTMVCDYLFKSHVMSIIFTLTVF